MMKFWILGLMATSVSPFSTPRFAMRRSSIANKPRSPIRMSSESEAEKTQRVTEPSYDRFREDADETMNLTNQFYGQKSVNDNDFYASSSLQQTVPSSDQELEVPVRDQTAVNQARLLLLASAALYGTNFSLVKILGDSMPVGVSTTLRFGLATLATLPWLIPRKNEDATFDEAAAAAWCGFEVGLWNSIGYISQAVGLETTDASKSAFICALAVVTVPLLEFATGKRLKSREWIGVALAVLGVGILELGGGQLQEAGPLISKGDLLSLVQPLAFGFGFWRMERAMSRFPTQASRTTAAQLLAVFIASSSYALWSNDMATLQSYPWHDWLTSSSILLSIFWTGVVTTAFTIYMETQALRTLSAAETTLIFSTEPLFGTAFAAVVVGEQIGVDAAVGGLFILAACLYSNLGMDGIRSFWKSAAIPQKVAGTRFGAYISKAPQRMQSEWLWLCCGVAANFLSFSLLLEEELPEVEQIASSLGVALETLFRSLPL